MANVADEMGPQGGRRGGRPPKLVRAARVRGTPWQEPCSAAHLAFERGERVAPRGGAESLPAIGCRNRPRQAEANPRANLGSSKLERCGRGGPPVTPDRLTRKGNGAIGSRPGSDRVRSTCSQADIRYGRAVMGPKPQAGERAIRPPCPTVRRRSTTSDRRRRQLTAPRTTGERSLVPLPEPPSLRAMPDVGSAPTPAPWVHRATRPVRCGWRPRACQAPDPSAPCYSV
jgi:hypothetical protein